MNNIICECTGNFIEGNEKCPMLSLVYIRAYEDGSDALYVDH